MIQIGTAIFDQKLGTLLSLVIGVLGKRYVGEGERGLNTWIQDKIIEIY